MNTTTEYTPFKECELFLEEYREDNDAIFYEATISVYEDSNLTEYIYTGERFATVASVHEWHRDNGYGESELEFRDWSEGNKTLRLYPLWDDVEEEW